MNRVLADFLYTGRAKSQARIDQLKEESKSPKDGSKSKEVLAIELKMESQELYFNELQLVLINKTIEVAWESTSAKGGNG